jgi:hypothetical protein
MTILSGSDLFFAHCQSSSFYIILFELEIKYCEVACSRLSVADLEISI